MKKRVVILGGGVAGLSAAHELIERGFEVVVHERRQHYGGKARSMLVPNSGTEGRADLPGEHGFRFFPGFYQNLPDTMKRIPFGTNPQGVFDNLVPTEREMLEANGAKPIITLPRFPRSLRDLHVMLGDRNEFHGLGIADDDLRFFAERLWKILTSCLERRVQDYERIPWWTFVDADGRSEAYRTYLAIGLTRTLVAAKAELASTKTIGDIAIQLIFNTITPGVSSDRILNGPTNDVWINPWKEYLAGRGVEFHPGSELLSIRCENGRIQDVTVREQGQTVTVTGDVYILALPVEVVARLLTPQMLTIDPTLGSLRQLASCVAWMNGVQLYLRQDVPIVRGHEMFLDTAWALTSISQAQFWPTFDFAAHGDGQVRGILSVDVSDWNTPGILYHRPARNCSREEIALEVWAQLKASLNVGGTDLLEDANLHSWFVDPDIYDVKNNPNTEANAEPLLVNLVNTWSLRPEAHTLIPNLFLASDYVRTFTDLATMEGANEAARRAVNAIIDATGSNASYCTVWPLTEPDVLTAWRLHDLRRYNRGLPWNPSPPHSVSIWLLEILIVLRDLIRDVVVGITQRLRRLLKRSPLQPRSARTTAITKEKDEVAAGPVR